jgi:hypothetical protein
MTAEFYELNFQFVSLIQCNTSMNKIKSFLKIIIFVFFFFYFLNFGEI